MYKELFVSKSGHFLVKKKMVSLKITKLDKRQILNRRTVTFGHGLRFDSLLSKNSRLKKKITQIF